MDIALAVSQWQKEEVPLKEIRARIDDEYSKLGYKPTPTPAVP
ncbi:MAG: hypothetical protein ACYC6O_00610 [Thermoleophilia bacterium]